MAADIYKKHLNGEQLTPQELDQLFALLAESSPQFARHARHVRRGSLIQQLIDQGHPKHTGPGGAFYIAGQMLHKSPEAMAAHYYRHVQNNANCK